MGTNKRTNFSLMGAVLMMTLLGACGSGASGAYGAYGACATPAGTPSSTAVADFGNGATLTLTIYSETASTIAAVGMLTIPSVPNMFAPYTGGPTSGPGQSIQTCVSSAGAVGTINASSVYQYIDLSLQGNGVYIAMNGNLSVPTYISNNNIEGSVQIELSGFQPTEFIAAPPTN